MCRGAVCAAGILLFLLIVCGLLYIKDRLFTGKVDADPGSQTQEGLDGSGFQGENLSQEPSEEEPSEQEKKYIVVLDAGHGGKDGGTSADGAREKDINLAIVLKMEKLLQDRGIETLLTREDDSFLKLADRAVMANDRGASLFVSIHCNAYDKDNRVQGLECYYHPDSESGKELAEGICKKLKEDGKIETRSARAEDYAVLRETECKSVLIEIGYLTNASEREKLLDEEYQNMLAEELVEALCSINTEMNPETDLAG